MIKNLCTVVSFGQMPKQCLITSYSFLRTNVTSAYQLTLLSEKQKDCYLRRCTSIIEHILWQRIFLTTGMQILHSDIQGMPCLAHRIVIDMAMNLPILLTDHPAGFKLITWTIVASSWVTSMLVQAKSCRFIRTIWIQYSNLVELVGTAKNSHIHKYGKKYAHVWLSRHSWPEHYV